MIPQEEKSRTMSRLTLQRPGPLGLAGSERGKRNYAQQFTVDRLFREPSMRVRAAHDCITRDGSSGAALRLC